MERKHHPLGEFAPHLCYGEGMAELLIPNGHPSSLVQFSTTLSSIPARPVYISPYAIPPGTAKKNMYSSPYSCITGPIMDEQHNMQASSGAMTYDPRDHPVSKDRLGHSMQAHNKNLHPGSSLYSSSLSNPPDPDAEHTQMVIIAAQASQLSSLPPPPSSWDKKQQQGSMSSSSNLQDGSKIEDKHVSHDIYQRQESRLLTSSIPSNDQRSPSTWNQQPSLASSPNMCAPAPRYDFNDNRQFALPQTSTEPQQFYPDYWNASNAQNQQLANFASSPAMPTPPPKLVFGSNIASHFTNMKAKSDTQLAFPQGHILPQDGTSKAESSLTAWNEQSASYLSSSLFDSPFEFHSIDVQFRDSQVDERAVKANNRATPWEISDPSYPSKSWGTLNGESPEEPTSLSSSPNIPHSSQTQHYQVYQNRSFQNSVKILQADSQEPSRNLSGRRISSSGWCKSPKVRHTDSSASLFAPHKLEYKPLTQFPTTQSSGYVPTVVHRATPYNFLHLPTPNYGVQTQSRNVGLETSRSTLNVPHPQYSLPSFSIGAQNNNASNNAPSLSGPLVGQPDFGLNTRASRYSVSVSHQPSTDLHFPPALAQHQADTLCQIAKPQEYHSHYIPQAYGHNFPAPLSLTDQQWGVENSVYKQPTNYASATNDRYPQNTDFSHLCKNTPDLTSEKEANPQRINPRMTHHHYILQADNQNLLTRPTSQDNLSPIKKRRGRPEKSSSQSKALPLHFKSPSVEQLEGTYPAIQGPHPGQPGYKTAPYHPDQNGPDNKQSRNDAPRKRNRNRNRNRTPAKSNSVINSEGLVAELHSELSPEQYATIKSINENDSQSEIIATQLEILVAELEALDADEETFSTARVMEISAEIEKLEKKLEEIMESGNRLEDEVNAKLRDDMEQNEKGFMLDLATLTK